MNIVSFNGYDLAGLSYNLCTAINKLTDHLAISVCGRSSWINYPEMERGNRSWADLAKNADVIHVNEFPSLLAKLGDLKGKIVIYHAHGQWYRAHRASIVLPEGTKFIASTADLLEFLPEDASWFPSVVPIEEYRRVYDIQRNEIPVVYHSSTKPRLGRPSLDILKNVLREKYKFEVQSVERLTHRENLTRKAKTDIYFDEIVHFYGVNAIEAAAFEIPVIHGATPFGRKYLQECPFLLATNTNDLITHMEALLSDSYYRRICGEQGLKYVQRMHSPEAGVKKFFEVIE